MLFVCVCACLERDICVWMVLCITINSEKGGELFFDYFAPNQIDTLATMNIVLLSFYKNIKFI